MKHICIALSLLLCQSTFPMRKCKSWSHITDLMTPLLYHADQDAAESITTEQPIKQSWRSLAPLKKSTSYHLLVEPKQNTTESAPQEAVAPEALWPENMQLQKYWQQSCSVYTTENQKELLVHATASRPTAADFTDIRKNQKWHSAKYKDKSEEIKQYQLGTFLIAIKGQVEVDCLLDKRKLQCCIFTSYAISTITLHPNGKILAIAGSDGVQNLLLLYHLKHGVGSKKLQTFFIPHTPSLIALSPSAKRILLCCTHDDPKEFGRRYACVYSLVNEHEEGIDLARFEEFEPIDELQCGWADENKVVALSNKGQLYEWHIRSESA